MFDYFYGFDENKLKPYIKMATQRIAIAVNKKSSQVKHLKREIAGAVQNQVEKIIKPTDISLLSGLLQDHKDEKARIKAEHLIREDFMIESFELISLLCELVHERVRYIASQQDCPPDLVECVSSLIWASSRVDIAELGEVRKQLIKKYGKKFAENADNNQDQVVNHRLFNKLTLKPPSATLVIKYLEGIAKEFQLEWTPVDIGLPNGPGGLMDAIPSPQGFSVPMAPGSELRSAYQRPANGTPGLVPMGLAGGAAAAAEEPQYFPVAPSGSVLMPSVPLGSVPVVPVAPAGSAPQVVHVINVPGPYVMGPAMIPGMGPVSGMPAGSAIMDMGGVTAVPAVGSPYSTAPGTAMDAPPPSYGESQKGPRYTPRYTIQSAPPSAGAPTGPPPPQFPLAPQPSGGFGDSIVIPDILASLPAAPRSSSPPPLPTGAAPPGPIQPPVAPGSAPSAADDTSFEALQARFAALQRRE